MGDDTPADVTMDFDPFLVSLNNYRMEEVFGDECTNSTKGREKLRGNEDTRWQNPSKMSHHSILKVVSALWGKRGR